MTNSQLNLLFVVIFFYVLFSIYNILHDHLVHIIKFSNRYNNNLTEKYGQLRT